MLRYLLLTLAVATFCVAAPVKNPDVDKRPVEIGGAKVELRVTKYPGSPLVFYHMHEDEITAVEATLKVISEGGGTLVELLHNGERRVRYSYQGRAVSIDPNRVFTPKGAAATVEPKVKGAAGLAEKFGETLIGQFVPEAADVVVAVHNNTDGKFSIASFLPGGDEAANAEDLHVAKDRDADDFFYVTHAGLYKELKKKGYNVILQNNDRAIDDGSLSVYCGQRGIPYVNVEAESGHVEEQVRMLSDLTKVIERVKPKREKPVAK